MDKAKEIDTHKNEYEQIKLKRFHKELFEQQGKVMGQEAEIEFDEKAKKTSNFLNKKADKCLNTCKTQYMKK